MLADNVGLFANAVIDAVGDIAGGDVKIGGDYQGQGDTPRAIATYVADSASVDVSALTSGDSGQAIVWSDDVTRFYGEVIARGGVISGNGGLVEVSGKNYLDFQGHVDTSATNGGNGQLLLDPGDIEVCLFIGGTCTATTPITTASSPFTPVGVNNESYLDIAVLLAALAGGDVTISTVGSTGTAGAWWW